MSLAGVPPAAAGERDLLVPGHQIARHKAGRPQPSDHRGANSRELQPLRLFRTAEPTGRIGLVSLSLPDVRRVPTTHALHRHRVDRPGSPAHEQRDGVVAGCRQLWPVGDRPAGTLTRSALEAVEGHHRQTSRSAFPQARTLTRHPLGARSGKSKSGRSSDSTPAGPAPLGGALTRSRIARWRNRASNARTAPVGASRGGKRECGPPLAEFEKTGADGDARAGGESGGARLVHGASMDSLSAAEV